MDEFRVKVRNRMFLLTTLFVVVITIYLILLYNQSKLSNSLSDIIDFYGGVLMSFSILIVLNIFKNFKALKSEKKLKKLYIKENDERTIMIMRKTGGIGINICIFGFAIATIIAGFFNETIFFTLLAATLYVALVKVLFKVYYHKKL
ncbi:hypothetical protein [Amphibacillus indicireducens]|uniref:Uncharacterized protein n=1 Tax=Amphibacillus indicireducens TaxID=1076330 RepID=A0ABP7V1I7_9BACI